MMELSKQVVSLPLAQKMKELGFEQESLFYITNAGTILHNPPPKPLKCYSAYTVAELGEMRPDGYFAYRRGSSWFTGKDLHQIAVAVASDTEANAKATLAIYLKENNLL